MLSHAVAPVTTRVAHPRTRSGSCTLFSRGVLVSRSAFSRPPRGFGRVAHRLATRAVATPSRGVSEAAASHAPSSVLGPSEAPSLRCGARRAALPYFGQPVDRAVLVNDAARAAIRDHAASPFIDLPDAESRELQDVRAAMERGWRRCEMAGSGSAKDWPELFEAGASLVRATVGRHWPSEAVAVFPGTGWFAEEETRGTDGRDEGIVPADRNIDWVMRRPEGHVVSSKIHFAARLHRDPDSWTNPRTPQRPKQGWTDLAMPEREKYSYRFVNVWVARSAIDPTGQVWQSPLVVCLPREGGRREWSFEKRKLTMDDEAAKKEFVVRGIDPMDPKTWIKGANRLFRPLWKGSSATDDPDAVSRRVRRGGDTGDTAAANATLTAEELDAFEFPELEPDDAHVFVAAPALVFDSFDLWHGSATWSDDEASKKKLRAIDVKGRQPFHRARCSVEMRFRIRIDVQKAKDLASSRPDDVDTSGRPEKNARGSVSPWGPFASSVASGKFRGGGLRDADARYDLEKGNAAET